jgi:hypothetical protein
VPCPEPEFRHAEVEELDLDNKVVRTSSGDLDYGSLVVSLGAQLAPETVPGFEQMAYNLYTTEGCARIHAALEDLSEGTIGVLITAMPFKCPAAPYEAAFLAESFVRRKGIRRNVEIHLFSPEHAPMPVAPPAVGDSIADVHPPPADVARILAGNIFHRHVVLGDFDSTRRDATGVTGRVLRNGLEIAATAEPAALTGDLVEVVRSTAGVLAACGEALRASEVVITGAVVPPIRVAPGERFRFELPPLGALELAFTHGGPAAISREHRLHRRERE